jgi:hypothetical protein
LRALNRRDVSNMSLSCIDGKLEEEQKIDRVLLTLISLVFAVIGYGVIHFLLF